MSRPLLELADLIRTAGTAFIERNRQWIRWPHLKVLLAIARCRTAALGGHIDECSRCGQRATISYNSCRSRPPSPTSRGRDRLLQCAPYLESETRAPSPRPLCRRRRWALPRSHPLDPIPLSLLSLHPCTPSCLSR